MEKGDNFKYKFTVSNRVYSGFINLFGDKNPLHTDVDFAMSKGFNGKVMHGNILNGFLSFFVGELLPVKNVIIQAQSVKYIKPVYLEDTLELNVEIAEIFESVNSIEFKFTFTNVAAQKVAKGTILVGII